MEGVALTNGNRTKDKTHNHVRLLKLNKHHTHVSQYTHKLTLSITIIEQVNVCFCIWVFIFYLPLFPRLRLQQINQ